MILPHKITIKFEPFVFAVDQLTNYPRPSKLAIKITDEFFVVFIIQYSLHNIAMHRLTLTHGFTE